MCKCKVSDSEEYRILSRDFTDAAMKLRTKNIQLTNADHAKSVLTGP